MTFIWFLVLVCTWFLMLSLYLYIYIGRWPWLKVQFLHTSSTGLSIIGDLGATGVHLCICNIACLPLWGVAWVHVLVMLSYRLSVSQLYLDCAFCTVLVSYFFAPEFCIFWSSFSVCIDVCVPYLIIHMLSCCYVVTSKHIGPQKLGYFHYINC